MYSFRPFLWHSRRHTIVHTVTSFTYCVFWFLRVLSFFIFVIIKSALCDSDFFTHNIKPICRWFVMKLSVSFANSILKAPSLARRTESSTKSSDPALDLWELCHQIRKRYFRKYYVSRYNIINHVINLPHVIRISVLSCLNQNFVWSTLIKILDI